MAKIRRYTNDVWRLQLNCPDGTRRSIYLSKHLTKRQAEDVADYVQRLDAAIRSGSRLDTRTANWLGQIDDELKQKLVKCGLAEQSEPESEPSISVCQLVDDYMATRVRKVGTKKRWTTVRSHLVKHFGENHPIDDISLNDADLFEEYLAGLGLAENTKRRYLGIAKQFFKSAVRAKRLEENPFRDHKTSITGNQEKNRFFVSREVSDRILATCPDAEWRLIFALMRFAGMRCPSEILAMKSSDINWEQNRFLIHSIKTEHIDGKETRMCPIFPELRCHLEACFDAAEAGSVFVISKHRMTHRGLTAAYRRILLHAAVPEYPKLFQNLRATRQTELAQDWPLHVITSWIGNSKDVALKHYLQVTEDDFSKATAVKSELLVKSSELLVTQNLTEWTSSGKN